MSQVKNIKKEIDDIPQLKEFSEITSLSNRLLKNISLLKFEYLSPIQNIIINLSNKKKDIIVCSETGTGKTISYLIPIINYYIKNGPPVQKENKLTTVYPLTLILLPTRELVEQVNKECRKLCYKTGINSIKIYGGIDYNLQILSLSKGCDILISTYGRLIDYLKIGIISLKYVNFFVLDEADKLLDSGFEKQLNSIIFDFDLIEKSKRINFMFSATYSQEIKKIIRKYMNDYYFIEPKEQQEKNLIKQEFIKINKEEKNKKIVEILNDNIFKSKIIIFTDTKINAENLYEFLYEKNIYKIDILTGNKNQNERKKTLENFKNEKFNILIATDIVGRGLDFINVDLIINYDIPKNKEDYIHRIGRTGRMGQKGFAITLIDDLKNIVLKEIILFLEKELIELPKWMKKISDNKEEIKNKKNKKRERSRSKEK